MDDIEQPTAHNEAVADILNSPVEQVRPPRVPEPLEPLDEVLRRRLTVIKEGDNVLLKLPSDTIKAVVASKDGLVLSRSTRIDLLV